MNILIVGGTGVISYAVVNEAVKSGINVTCINRGRSKEQRLPSNVEVICADYRNRGLMENKLKERSFDAIVDVLCYTEKDIEYSISLFKDKCKQYIFFSSCAVYNKGEGNYECTEDSELINPVWPYSIKKVECERKLIQLASKYGVKYTIVRPAVTYGNTRIPYGITPPYGYHGTLIQRILNKKPIILWDEGQTISTITRVEDFATGLVSLLGNEKAYNQAFHIVGDERHTWKEVIETLGEILGVAPIYFSLSKEVFAEEMSARKGEILGGRGINQLLDNSKIKSISPSFGTHIPLKEGLKMTIEYYINHNYLKGIDYAFDGEWDRIIIKYAAKDKYKLGFVDYLKNATSRDQRTYYFALHKYRYDIRFISMMQSIIRRLKKALKH